MTAGRFGTDAGREFERTRLRVLKWLASGPAVSVADADGCVLRRGGGVSVKIPANVWKLLLRSNLLTHRDDGSIRLSDMGRSALRRALSLGDGFTDQHRHLRRDAVQLENGSRHVATVNDAESPLSWLRRRRDRAGKPFLNDGQFAAGERLREDYTRAHLLPSVTSSWSRDATATNRRSGERGGNADLTDAAIAARARVRAALDHVGPELSGVLIDVCCFLKGLELVETERGWPARSGKAILALALTSLERHYETGKNDRRRRRGGHHWGAAGYRPSLE